MDESRRVALYARVSSQRQAEEATIQSQVAALAQRIAADQFRLDPQLRFLDEGYSGATLLRPALERLRDLIHAGAVDILNVDATIAGGITEWRRIAGLASATGVAMAHHEEPQVAVHLLASIPHGLCVEIFQDPLRDPMWWELPLNRPVIKDGYMHAPDAPGLGIDLSLEVIAKFHAVQTVA